MSLVTCARVGDALTDWLDTASQLKKDALCEALGCGHTDEEIAAVFMNCDGVAHIPGTAIPSCDEMDAAITAAIEDTFTGGTDGQVWTKRADGTQGWADPSLALSTTDSTSAAFTGDGTAANPLSADVIVNPDADNLIEQTGTGLKVSPELPAGGTADQVLTTDAAGEAVWADPAEQPVNTANSASVAITGDGTAVNPLTATTLVSVDPDNALVVEVPGGLFSHTTNLSWDNVAKTFTYVNNKGQSVTVDLSQFEVDLHVDNATFDPATTLLTLNVAGGTPVVVDLGALAAVTVDGTTTVALTGDGTAATPLQAEVKLDAAANNRLTASATGLLVTPELPAGGAAGQVLTKGAGTTTTWNDAGLAAVATTDTPTIDFSGDGTAATPVTGAVKLATGGVNRITAEATGLRVTPELPAYTAADNGKKLVIVAGVPEWQEDAPCLVETRAGTGTLVEDDTGKLVLGTGGTITAPASLPIGFRVDLVGEVTVAVTGGTLRSVDGNTKVVADGGATLIKTSATEFWLAGALEA